MSKPNTYFEQVPVDVVKNIAKVFPEPENENNGQRNSDMDAQIRPRPDGLQYEWQSAYRDALLEVDKQKLKLRIATAEAAICARQRAMANSCHSVAERLAVEDALAFIRVLKENEGLNE